MFMLQWFGKDKIHSVQGMNVFVYGTLMRDDIRDSILGKITYWEEDSLDGFTKEMHPDLPYPCIFNKKDSTVYGIRFKADEEDLKRLDRYETEFYKRIIVKLNSGEESFVYVENLD